MKQGSFNIPYKVLILILIMIDVFLVLYSCQRHDSGNPVTNGIPLNEDGSVLLQNPVPILVTGEADGDVLSGVGTLGVYYASVDQKTHTGELTPLRKSEALGDIFDVDITGYLNGSPCGNCFKLDSLEVNERMEILATFSLRHPFPLPSHNPPEYRERLDLHVFDVRAIFFLTDEKATPVSFSKISNAVLQPIGGTDILDSDNSGFWASEQWDGTTGLFDQYVDTFWHTDSDIHPYKMFFVDGSRGNIDANSQTGFTDPYNPSGHNVFPQGGGPDVKTINLGYRPQSNYGFIVLITAAYGQSARFWGSNSGQRGNPRYYLPEFNVKEPWRVKVSIPSETDMLSAGNTTSSTILKIEVCDWQHSYGRVAGDYDPHTAPFDSIQYSSKVKNVYVEIPGVSNLDQASVPVSGTGLGDDPLVYSIIVNNDFGADEGLYTGLVAVTDELHGTNLEGYGVKRDGITLFDVNSFVTYAVFQVDVIERGGSFGIGYNMTSSYGVPSSSGVAISLDSMSGDNILVDGNMVHVVASILEGPGGDEWDIFYFRSTNHGYSFEPMVMLNNDYQYGKLGDQIQPSLAVAPDTGRLYFVFTDKSHLRDGVVNDAIFMRYSMDDGLTFSAPATRISMADKPCDQPTIATSLNGFVWIAYRLNNSDTDKSLLVRTSFNYGQEFYLSFAFHTLPSNFDNPILLSQLSQSNWYLVGLIWRQESPYASDLKFTLSLDAGGAFNVPANVSNEAYYEYALSPRADLDKNGNIYLAYKVQNHYNESKKVMVTYGQRNMYDYQFENLGQLNPDFTPIGDLDVYAAESGHVFIAYNYTDISNDNEDQDLAIYKSSTLGDFSLLTLIPEASTPQANQEMPRISGNEQGEIFLLYKDNSFSYGGDIFLTMGLDK